MSAKDLAVFDVERGMSIHRAAQNHGITYGQLYRHISLLNRHSSNISTPKETLIGEAVEAVKSKR